MKRLPQSLRMDWNYRQTFLHGHVPRILDRSDEVLAVDHLLRRAASVSGRRIDELAEGDRRWLLDQFFGSDPEQDTTAPDLRVWLPIRLIARPPGVQHPLDSLTTLLGCLTVHQDCRGVLLLARSGAGKTLASLKAFRDCFCRVWEEDATEPRPPLLAGHLPLWLPVNDYVPAVKKLRDTSGNVNRFADLLLDQLMLRAAGMMPTDATSEQLQSRLASWLEYSPPLLLFVDLNAADDMVRGALAIALGRLQKKFHDIGQPHRCVITYRSVRADDANINTLQRTGCFLSLEMRPIDAGQATEYLRNYRSLEKRFFNRMGLPLPKRELTVDDECDLLARLVGQTRGSESVISTPLLMHFASTLDKGLAGVRSVAQLYDAVVEQFLERELDPPDEGGESRRTLPGQLADPKKARVLVKVVMTRVALAILARDPKATRLQVTQEEQGSFDDLLGQLLQDPEQGLPGMAPSSWPTGEGFWKAPYYTVQLSTDEQQDVLEVSLLRGDGNALRFVHDSFVYYFAGVLGLREYKRPGAPMRGSALPENWFSEVVARIREHPEAWELAAEFLGGVLDFGELRTLAVEFLVAEPKSGLSRVLRQLVMGRPLRGQPEDDCVLAELERALRRPEAHRRPEGLFGLCDHWLRDAGVEEPACEAFALERLESAVAETKRVWLRAKSAMPRPKGLWHRLHAASAFLVELEYSRLASGGRKDGKVIIWDLETGITTEVFRHKGRVCSLLSLSGESLASSGSEGVVQVWNGHGRGQEVFKHKSQVDYLQRLSKEKFASGGRDGVVAVWDGHGRAQEVFEHDGKVTCLQTLSAGALASGGLDGVVAIWNGHGRAQEVFRHNGKVTCLQTLSTGGWASGGQDGVVAVCDSHGRVQEIFQHEGKVNCLQPLLGGGLASGGQDGMLTLWDGQGKAFELFQHERKVNCMEALSGGGFASGDNYGVVVVWIGDGKAFEVFSHKGKINFLRSLSGGWLASGSKDGVVAVWNGQTVSREVYQHGGPVRSLLAFPDGGLASGGRDGVVAVSDGCMPGQEVFRHQLKVDCLQMLSHGRFASSGYDGVVAICDRDRRGL